MRRRALTKFRISKRALAIPVTYLMLFVPLMAIIFATYSFAVAKISTHGASLKASVAKLNMQSLDDAVLSVAWSQGSLKTVYMDDCGGAFKTQPAAKNLMLNFTDEQTFYDVVFNSSVGEAFYELESVEEVYDGFFIRGDERAVVNQSAFTMTQLYFEAGDNAKQLTLCYRPSVTAAPIGTSNEKPLNIIRVYVLNLNSSQTLMLREKFYLRVTAVNVTTVTKQYEFNVSVSSLALKADFDGTQSTVWLPITSIEEGAIVNLEVVICNVTIQRAEV